MHNATCADLNEKDCNMKNETQKSDDISNCVDAESSSACIVVRRSCDCIQAGLGLNHGEILFDILCKKCPNKNKKFCIHSVATNKNAQIIEQCEYYKKNSIDFSSKSIECKYA